MRYSLILFLLLAPAVLATVGTRLTVADTEPEVIDITTYALSEGLISSDYFTPSSPVVTVVVEASDPDGCDEIGGASFMFIEVLTYGSERSFTRFGPQYRQMELVDCADGLAAFIGSFRMTSADAYRTDDDVNPGKYRVRAMVLYENHWLSDQSWSSDFRYGHSRAGSSDGNANAGDTDSDRNFRNLIRRLSPWRADEIEESEEPVEFSPETEMPKALGPVYRNAEPVLYAKLGTSWAAAAVLLMLALWIIHEKKKDEANSSEPLALREDQNPR